MDRNRTASSPSVEGCSIRIQHQGGDSSLVPIRKESAKRRVGNLIGLELIPDQFEKQSGDVDLSGEEVGKG